MYASITDEEFAKFQALIYDEAGISMSSGKKALISSRLMKRLRHFGLNDFGEYYSLITSGRNQDEFQHVIDLLTTNETYFYREPKHFELLQEKILPESNSHSFRVWSGACSNGSEPYSIGMLLTHHLKGRSWEILATDISTRILANAKEGLYPIEATQRIPEEFLNRYCLKGVRSQDGLFLIDDDVKRHIKFQQMNLNGADWPEVGMFDVIFLRNVMIYFDQETKRRLVTRILSHLSPGGYFIIGHSESLNGIPHELETVTPSVYYKR